LRTATGVSRPSRHSESTARSTWGLSSGKYFTPGGRLYGHCGAGSERAGDARRRRARVSGKRRGGESILEEECEERTGGGVWQQAMGGWSEAAVDVGREDLKAWGGGDIYKACLAACQEGEERGLMVGRRQY
jgi:hypothetical protein